MCHEKLDLFSTPLVVRVGEDGHQFNTNPEREDSAEEELHEASWPDVPCE
jgi:hypothetical protein